MRSILATTCGLGLLLLTVPVRAEPPTPPVAGPDWSLTVTIPEASPAAAPTPAAVSTPAVVPPSPSPSPVPPAVEDPSTPDTAAARTEATDRLSRLAGPDAPAGAGADKELREVLDQRLRLLKEFDKTIKERKDAEHPEVSPDQEAGELKADQARIQSSLEQAGQDPEALLPEIFRVEPGRATGPALSEMKEAIDQAEDDLRDRKAALEGTRSDPARDPGKNLATLRARRDEVRQSCAALTKRKGELEAARDTAGATEARDLARERLVNLDWECRLVSERLRAADAQIALESGRAALTELRLQVQTARCEQIRLALDRMRARYRVLADRQQRDLQRDAAAAAARAAQSADPLEHYRGRRSAELLDLQAQWLKDERTLAGSPAVSLQEQTTLAEHAQEDFTRLKKLVEGGRSNTRVALRLYNNFRRLAAVRESIVRNELAQAVTQLTRYEDALADVELEVLNDTRDDRFILDALLGALPPARRSEAIAASEEFETRHRTLLDDRRRALEKLVARAEAARQQIMHRIQILDDQHAFIRTRIFWVRDTDPIGPTSLAQANRELHLLLRALIRVVTNPSNRSPWARVTPDFALALFAVLVLPWPLHRAHRSLKTYLQKDRQPLTVKIR